MKEACFAWLQVPHCLSITTFLQAGDQTRWTVQKAQVCGDGFRHSSGFTAAFEDEDDRYDRVISISPWNLDHVKTEDIQ